MPRYLGVNKERGYIDRTEGDHPSLDVYPFRQPLRLELRPSVCLLVERTLGIAVRILCAGGT